MRPLTLKVLSLVLIALLFLSACRGSPLPPPPTQAAATLPATNAAPSPSPTSPTATPTRVVPTATLAPSRTPLPTSTPVPQAYGPENIPANINPLTGAYPASSELLERRPLSTKIELFPRGHRPAWGISLADIVYDYYQNNGLTRLNTVFYGNDAKTVGPIRSARLFDRFIIRMYKAIFAFGGADKRIIEVLFGSDFANRLVVEGSNNCPPMCRYDPNGANLLITNTSELGKYAASKGVDNTRQDLKGMSFDPLAPAQGEPGSQVFTRFSISAYVRWDYDLASGRYLRFQDTVEASDAKAEAFAPFMDRLNESQVAADNVVVLLVPHKYVVQSKSSEIIDILLNGAGPAYAFRDGSLYKVKWTHNKSSDVLFLTLADGKPYPFKPGNTWFEVVGEGSKIIPLDGGAWRFEFRIP